MKTPLFISAIRARSNGQFAATAQHDFYMVHRLVYAAFPTKEDATAARVLFRFDIEGEDGFLYVQTQAEPDWSRLPKGLNLRVVGPLPYDIPDEDRLRFRLLAKPSFRAGAKTGSQSGVRTTIVEPAQQRAWLERNAALHGFRIEECLLTERIWHDGKTKETLPNGNPKPLCSVQFDGVLAVTGHEKLREAVHNGIGSQKAFGFGLLSLSSLQE